MTRTARLLAFALAVSLGANLVVAGVAIGWYARSRPAGAGGVQRFLQMVPAEARKPVAEAFRAHRAEITAKLRAIAEARAEVADALAAQSFDPAALDKAFADLRARNLDAQQLMHTIFASAVAELPPSTRTRVGEQWGAGR